MAPQKRKVGALRSRAQTDRGVVLDLPRHQDHPASIAGDRGQRTGEAVFRQCAVPQPRDQRLRTVAPARRQGGGGQRLKVAFAAGVITDAARIRDQRQRRDQVGAQAARAQEPVLDPQRLRHVLGAVGPSQRHTGQGTAREAHPAPVAEGLGNDAALPQADAVSQMPGAVLRPGPRLGLDRGSRPPGRSAGRRRDRTIPAPAGGSRRTARAGWSGPSGGRRAPRRR